MSNIRGRSSRNALVHASGKARYLSSQLQFKQHRRYDLGRQAGALDQLVDAARLETHLHKENVVLAGRRRDAALLFSEAKLLEDVLGAFDELRSLFDESVAPLG